MPPPRIRHKRRTAVRRCARAGACSPRPTPETLARNAPAVTSLSFVIPAKNEERYIGATIDSIRRHCSHPHEIVVVDNHSTDGTVSVAERLGATATRAIGSIGMLRNIGAAMATGDVLVFLDADVTLTSAWTKNIDDALRPILDGEPLVTGSHCLPTDADNLLERYWFRALATDPRSTHVGSAHLIVGRARFLAVGGFEPLLATGEDYEFCTRAQGRGCTIRNDPRLEVIHHGFPTRLAGFMRREAWHGLGDLSSLAAFLGSRVALATVVFLGLHALVLLGVALGAWLASLAFALALAGLLLTSSTLKYRHAGGAAVLVNSLLFYPYFLGRSWGLLRFLMGERRLASPRT
jgi:glycosyltransferase involved in cell wall biosynthesis